MKSIRSLIMFFLCLTQVSWASVNPHRLANYAFHIDTAEKAGPLTGMDEEERLNACLNKVKGIARKRGAKIRSTFMTNERGLVTGYQIHGLTDSGLADIILSDCVEDIYGWLDNDPVTLPGVKRSN